MRPLALGLSVLLALAVSGTEAALPPAMGEPEPIQDITPMAPPKGAEIMIYRMDGQLLLSDPRLAVIRIKGDSMWPLFRDGQRAIYIRDPAPGEVGIGSVILFDSAGCLFLPPGLILHQVASISGSGDSWKAGTRGSMKTTDAFGLCPVTAANLRGLVVAPWWN